MKVGRVFVHRKFFDFKNIECCAKIFSGMIVLEATQCFDRDGIEYLAVHNSFDEKEPGIIAPIYKAVFESGSDLPRWVRQ